MADPRAVITVILLLFILFSPSPTPEQLPSAKEHLVDILAHERRDLDLLNTTKYGDFDAAQGRFFNITGLQPDNGFAWEKLPDVIQRARKLSAHALGSERVGLLDGFDMKVVDPDKEKEMDKTVPLYKNITGVVHGEWVRSPLQDGLTSPILNISRYLSDTPFSSIDVRGFGRNLTDESKTGWLRLVFEESDSIHTLLSTDAGSDIDGDGKKEMGGKRDVLRQLRASVGFDSPDTGDEWEATLYGLHFLDSGSMIFTTTSDKFAGIFALPHMTVSRYQYGLAQELLNRTLATAIHRQEAGLLHRINPWSSIPETQTDNGYSAPKCELIIYLQQHPLLLPSSTLPLIEAELRDPTGAFPPPPSDMRFSMLAFSPDCGYLLESKGPPDYAPQEGNHLTGLKVEVEWLRARHHILIFSVPLFLQVLLLVRQMQDASTPSTRSRISFYTIAMLALGDGYTTMTLCLASLFVQAVWVPLIGSAFLAFISVSFFGMRFLLDIYTVQAPERERAERARREALLAANPSRPTTAPPQGPVAAPPPSQTPIITAAGADTLPPPPSSAAVPQPLRPIDTGATPVFIPSDQDITQPSSPPPGTNSPTLPTTNPAAATTTTNTPSGPGFGALYTRFYFLLLATLFVSLNAASWPPSLRRTFFTLLAFAYLSVWLPQIHRNVHRNCRRALRWDFVLGQSLLRLVPFFYFYGYSNNVVFASVDAINLAVLVAWLWLQVCVLLSQEILGPRWFLPNTMGASEWVPKAYDYHPILRQGDEEGVGGNLPIGAAEAFAATATTNTATPTSPTRKKNSSSRAGSRRASVASENSRDGRKQTFDCAICMSDLEVPVFGGAEGAKIEVPGLSSGALLLERRKYMVTPCRHIFHSACLEGWMKYRLQCPVCREELPPV